MPRNYFLINLIFLIIIGLLSFRFYKVWARPLDVPTHASLQQHQIDKKSITGRKEKDIRESSYQIIVKKDLFRPTRSAAPKADTSRKFSSKENPKLFGTMVMNNENVAILEDPSTKTTKLYYVNDSIAGFIVSDIQKDRIILKKGNRTIEVKLRDTKGFKSPSSSLQTPRHSIKRTDRRPKKIKKRKPRRSRRPKSPDQTYQFHGK